MNYFFRNIFLLLACLCLGSFHYKRDPSGPVGGSAEIDSAAYYKKLAFISELTQYLQKEFGLETGDSFYTVFQKEDRPKYYVYFSSPDSIYCSGTPYQYFDTDEEAAIERQKELDRKGYHTLLYHTAGTSAARLNSLLISYRYETVSFILFHEAMHRHLTNKKADIPYEFTEAACDVLANYGALSASGKMKELKKRTAKKQLRTNEKIYSVLNKYDSILKPVCEKTSRDSVFRLCENEIGRLLLRGDAFQNDRFKYKVNNAYFLRNRDYARNYFLLRDIYLQTNDPGDFLGIILNLPPEKTGAVKTPGK